MMCHIGSILDNRDSINNPVGRQYQSDIDQSLENSWRHTNWLPCYALVRQFIIRIRRSDGCCSASLTNVKDERIVWLHGSNDDATRIFWRPTTCPKVHTYVPTVPGGHRYLGTAAVGTLCCLLVAF